MAKRYPYVICMLTLLFACSPKKESQQDGNGADTVATAKATTVQADSSGTTAAEKDFTFDDYLTTDTNPAPVLRVTDRQVIIISPDDKQVDEMRKEYGEEDYLTVLDDGMYYQSTAAAYCDTLQLKTVMPKERYVQFVGANQTWTLDLQKKEAPYWNIILFNPTSKPECIDAISVTPEKLREYFGL